MKELVIQTHDFELAKKRLKDFSQKKAAELELKTVKTDGGLFGLGNHRVRGDELNSRLGIVQQHLIDLNATNNQTIKEFSQVYQALEALDKDYIQAILISIKATEKTSQRIEKTQAQMKKVVSDQKKTLEVLKKFKQKLDSYDHLGDIDKMWDELGKWPEEIGLLTESITNSTLVGERNIKKIDTLQQALGTTDQKLEHITEELNHGIENVAAIQSFMRELASLTHLHDIDQMWSTLEANNAILTTQDIAIKLLEKTYEQQQEALEGIHEQSEAHATFLEDLFMKHKDTNKSVQQNKQQIEGLLAYKEELASLTHLHDIDQIWNKLESNNTTLSTYGTEINVLEKSSLLQLEELEAIKKKSDDHVVALAEQKEVIMEHLNNDRQTTEATIQQMKGMHDEHMQTFTKKVKFAYVFAGVATGLAIVQLVVLLTVL